jgi:hypothetical protein
MVGATFNPLGLDLSSECGDLMLLESLTTVRLENKSLVSYGVVSLPNEVGSFDLECPTWRPMTGWKEESYTFYLGGPPKLVTSGPVSSDLDLRKELSTMSSGTVHIHCETLMKGFVDAGISGSK